MNVLEDTTNQVMEVKHIEEARVVKRKSTQRSLSRVRA